MTGGVESRIASSVVPSDLLAHGSLTDALFCVRHCVLQERVSGPAFRRPRHAVDGLRAATRVQTLPRSDLQKQATKLTPAPAKNQATKPRIFRNKQTTCGGHEGHEVP